MDSQVLLKADLLLFWEADIFSIDMNSLRRLIQ